MNTIGACMEVRNHHAILHSSAHLACLALLAVTVCMPAAADESADDDAATAPAGARHWQVELKRQSTNRGTESESTKTTLRIETLTDGPIALLRLDLPFPDEKTDFEGSPFHPQRGDLKVKAGFAPFSVGGAKLTPLVELTFPTADPDSQGSGKYQIVPEISSAIRLTSMGEPARRHELSLGWLVKQVVSFGGDENRKDINYTSVELALRDTWRKAYSAKLTFKPVIDWEQNGKTGAVGELEGAMDVSRHWRVALMGGGLLWGSGVPSTYGARVELTVRYRF